ncbi:hypothetical protein [Candidatus Berkiella aquae]|uniref:YHYH domain-containing protein n=1 Tax=Candidatus Berkiella aquae TaxID=295108 RepID=A0A0Q9YUF5_9GAMM|nr:hypothetical protein [Candidatus Berkiella aquae]MCS5710914.1 hypothetical protein [Candidatus Berkiella aquae]
MKAFILAILMIFSTAVFAKPYHYDDGHHYKHHHHHHHKSGIYFYGPGTYYGKTPGYRYYRDGTVKRCWRHHGHKHCRYYRRY